MPEPLANVWTQVYVEWDEPGAGGICVNGERVIHFSIDTDWSDPWNQQVNEVGLRLIDQLPRLVQEREMAYATAQELEAERDAERAKNGRGSER
jgi:hypothetical protein